MTRTVSEVKNPLTRLFLGVEPRVLRKYLLKHKTRLMLSAHLPLDNVPRNSVKLAAMMAAKLPSSEYPELRKHISDLSPGDLPSVEDALSTLKTLEELNSDADAIGVDADELARSRQAVLLAFLAQDDPDVKSYVVPAVRPKTPVTTRAQKTEQELEKKDPDKGNTLNPPVDRAAIPAKPRQGGGIEPQSSSKLDSIEEGLDEVVARSKHPQFAEVIGVRRNGVWCPIDSLEDRQRLFPQSGDIYVPGHMMNKGGHFCSWKVQHRPSRGAHMSSEYRATQAAGTVYEVVRLNANTKEVDRVRKKLQEVAKRVELSTTIFQLDDELLFKLKHVRNLLTSDFPEPADAWSSLDVISGAGYSIVLGPLRDPDTTYDLADVALVARRLLTRAGSVGNIHTLTKIELTTLSQWVADGTDSAAVSRRIERVISKLGDISRQKELLQEFMTAIAQTDEFKSKIESRINAAERQFFEEKAEIAAEIESLKREKEAIQKAIGHEKTIAHEASLRIAKSARRAFDKAVAKGEETLGESAVFAALVGRSAADRKRNDHSNDSQPIEPRHFHTREPETFSDALTSCGFSKERALCLSEVIQIALKAGMIVSVRGSGASFVTERLAYAAATGPGITIQVTPGLINGSTITSCLEHKDLQVICLFNANLSATEIYAHDLERLVWQRLFSKSTEIQPRIFCSIADSPCLLPLGQSFRTVCTTIDLDAGGKDPDPGLTTVSWAEEVLESMSSAGDLQVLKARIIRRLASNIPENTTQRVLTELRSTLSALGP